MNAEQALTALSNGIRKTGSPACQQSDPEAWFPEGGTPSPNKNLAVSLCRACPVQRLCLEYALANNEQHGIWGGMYTRQRERLLKAARTTSLR